LQLGDLKKAGEVLTVLTGAGADTEQVNGLLASFAKTLATELQNANARLIGSGDDAAAKQKAESDVAGVKQLLGMLVGQIAKRQHNSLPSMIYLAELSDKVGEADSARDLYTTVLPLAEKDPKFAKIVPRLRSNLAGLERQKGNYDAALTQIDAMLKESPNALEPLMEKGRILQAWGEKDPAKFAEAVNHWASLSSKLRAMKPQKPEFFEVNYNAALCLLTEAETTQDQAKKAEKAMIAGKLLKGLLYNSPKLDGPENVARYKELIKRVDKVIPMANKSAKG
jgi:tetratricopeptide (TPR) repeat protein